MYFMHLIDLKFLIVAVSCTSSMSLTALNTLSLSLLAPLDKDPRSPVPNTEWARLEFRIIIDTKSGPPETIILMASSLQEKASWCSDISQVRRYRLTF